MPDNNSARSILARTVALTVSMGTFDTPDEALEYLGNEVYAHLYAICYLMETVTPRGAIDELFKVLPETENWNEMVKEIDEVIEELERRLDDDA
jgi:hypothetical protein